KTFFQLIQIDGFNPLEIRPSTFSVKEEKREVVEAFICENIRESKEDIFKITNKAFTPGQISNCIERFNIKVECGDDLFLEKLLSYCDQNIEAGFGEGYWSDHWDYNMDLIESFLKIYPDKEIDLLFDDNTYRFYNSPVRVLARKERNATNKKGKLRQYNFLVHDEEVLSQKGFKKDGTNWLKTKVGSFATTTLMGKLISLALNKFASLDFYGMGIEMEGGKPGWNDAMNGLPGLFGSGMSETFELNRLIDFICSSITMKDSILLPVEVYDFLKKVFSVLESKYLNNEDEYSYWDKVSTLKEEYREQVRFYLDGAEVTVSSKEIFEIFKAFGKKVEEGIQRASQYGELNGENIVPTYFTYSFCDKDYEVKPLPTFLEGPTKMLGNIKDRTQAKELHTRVKASGLYDNKLKMYKTSVPLDNISMENGRIRAFTAGWLERESVFLHMEYKYLLSMLKSGLYEEFFEELPNTFIAFRDPKEYGRSILENSSFIASSVNPDETIHGRGYVARLSGSTTEAISMWIQMFMGKKIFTYENKELQLHLEPKLPSWMFDSNDKVSFTFLSKCKVTYYNPSHKNTYGENAAKIKEILIVDSNEKLESSFIVGELAENIRDGQINEIIINLE
ncbi:MAG: cellobiose phosphorylase, partial [Clostridiales bacterium]|nr:cellobiose phosphorylase [Clostridiales bacterium]